MKSTLAYCPASETAEIWACPTKLSMMTSAEVTAALSDGQGFTDGARVPPLPLNGESVVTLFALWAIFAPPILTVRVTVLLQSPPAALLTRQRYW